ncbi:MAG: SDR family NAD(P)-dependent oxidoreductase [Azonexus sp.]|jgi:NAD(P)-dependent dehydrogenase (short-subunit alcohol dehydrogenase family)|nr:SDR family NAD(P)-dependent oxidoreductase [Azonexus sp.]
MQIDNKVFLITGAGSGLGLAAARLLVSAGAKVALADLNRPAGEAAASELGPSALFVETDVASESSATEAVRAAVAHFGGLNGLVNCAGIVHGEKVAGKNGPHRLETFTKVININLVGTFNMIRLAVDAMLKNEADAGGERGVIINTASVAAFEGQFGQTAYSASKGGIVAMTLPVARELAASGIRCLTIAPGIMETPMLLGMAPEVQAALNNMVPFPTRMGKPAEFAALVRHIIENAYLNGEVIRLDGAIRMSAK